MTDTGDYGQHQPDGFRRQHREQAVPPGKVTTTASTVTRAQMRTRSGTWLDACNRNLAVQDVDAHELTAQESAHRPASPGRAHQPRDRRRTSSASARSNGIWARFFGKLGISSRRELRDALPDPDGLPLRA